MVTVAQCRDSMKTTMLKYMGVLFFSIIGSVYYLGAKLATLETNIAYNTKTLDNYRRVQINETEKFTKKLDVIVDNSRGVFEKCCDTRMVRKKRDGNDITVQ